jgi:hypothetical protein
MLILNPPVVRFATHVWEDAVSVALDRVAAKVAENYADAGPYTAFADVPERRTIAKVTRRLDADDLDTPALGDEGDLVFYAAPAGAGRADSPLGLRTRCTLHCVLTGVHTEVPPAHDPSARPRPATQTLTFLGVNPNGADPLTLAPARITD